MKKYTTPCVMVEEFEANEAVAVCYGVRCEIGSGNPSYSESRLNIKYYSNGKTYSEFESVFKADALRHTSDCGSNTVIRDDMKSIYEAGKRAGKGSIQDWTDKNGNGKLDSGDTIYWTNTNWAGTTYHHFGTLTSQDASHPNRS